MAPEVVPDRTFAFHLPSWGSPKRSWPCSHLHSFYLIVIHPCRDNGLTTYEAAHLQCYGVAGNPAYMPHLSQAIISPAYFRFQLCSCSTGFRASWGNLTLDNVTYASAKVGACALTLGPAG